MFEELTDKLNELGLTAIKKTGEVAEIAALKAKIISGKKKIQDSYTELGRAVYGAYKEEPGEFAGRIEEISAASLEVERLEKELKRKLNGDFSSSERRKRTEAAKWQEDARQTESDDEAGVDSEASEERQDQACDAKPEV